MNTKFEWTDELVAEFAAKMIMDLYCNNDSVSKPKNNIAAFIASKTKPKEYEILQFNREGRNLYLTYKNCYDSIVHDENKTWYVGTLEQLLEEKATIVKVKRISDGEAFSIDLVTEHGKITGFQIGEDNHVGKLIVFFEHLTWLYLEQVKKAKPTLFTTEDGVAVREGDDVFIVSKDDFTLSDKPYKTSSRFVLYSETQLYFSTKEKALEWIYLNKPVLSAADVYSTTAKYDIYVEKIEKEIEQLAKSKIK